MARKFHPLSDRRVVVTRELDVPMPARKTNHLPDPEVPDKPKRRTFTADYKLAIVREAAVCKEPGQIGALLRREGLYDTQLCAWRKLAAAGELTAFTSRQRGRPPQQDAASKELARLQRENARLQERLRKAELIIDVQKKISHLLGIEQPPMSLDEPTA